MLCPPTQYLVETTPTETKKARAPSSPNEAANTVAGWATADRNNRGQNRAFTCRARILSGWIGPSQTSEQRIEQRPHILFAPLQWLAEPTTTNITVAREAPSPVEP
jgi:hypothetical protein